MVGATTVNATGGDTKMTSSRARETDISLFADVLEPFRRVIGSVAVEEDREKRPTATRLSFSEQNIETVVGGKDGSNMLSFGKRKSSTSSISSATPDKRARTETPPTPSASPWEARRLRADLIAAKAQITKLESRINQQHLVRKEMQILFEEERATAAEQARRDRSAISAIEERLALVRRRESDLKEELAEANQNHEESKEKWDKERTDLHKQIADLKDKVQEINASSKGQLSEMKKDMDELLQALEGAQGEVEVLKREVARQTARARDGAALLAQADRQGQELQQATRQLRELQYERDSYKDWQQQAKTAMQRLSHMAELEREVGRLRAAERELRDQARGKLLLEEKVNSLAAQLGSLQPAHQELHAAKVRVASLESALEEWVSEARKRGAESAQQLAGALDAALHKELQSVADCGQAKTQLANSAEDLATAKFERDKATTKLTELQAVRKNQESLIHRLQKRLLLVTRERDSYRQQLDCYEKELSMTICGEGGGGGGGTALMTARIEQLERSLQSYRNMLDQIDTEAATKGSERLQGEASRWRQEAESLQRDVSKLRAQRDRLQAQLENLQAPLTKVLHLEDNPAASAHKDLQCELEAAQQEIKRLKSGRRDSSADGAVAALRKQLESSHTKLQRIKEEYASSAQEYRDVCYMLLGYKIDRTGHKNYRLSSMYAESADEYLTFMLCDEGIEMVHTDYSASLVDLVELHLHQNGSIPLFLSALTAQLFSHATVLAE